MSLDVQRAILAALEEGRPGVVATVLRHRGSSPGKTHHKMLVLADGTTVGTVGGGVLEAEILKRCENALRVGEGESLKLTVGEGGENSIGGVCGGSVEVAIELLPRVPRILLCGGGHCAFEIAKILDQLNYLTEVHDSRSEFATADRFPNAVALHTSAVGDLRESVAGFDRFTHVVLISHNHFSDRIYGRAVIQSEFTGHVGMIASKKKETTVRRLWREDDGLDAEFVARVVSPLGIPIGARTPAEIALSIVGWVVKTVRESGPR